MVAVQEPLCEERGGFSIKEPLKVPPPRRLTARCVFAIRFKQHCACPNHASDQKTKKGVIDSMQASLDRLAWAAIMRLVKFVR